MSIAALFIIAKIYKQPKCPQMGKCIKKIYIYIFYNGHTHTDIVVYGLSRGSQPCTMKNRHLLKKL